jgi:hypothetical protein
MEEEEMEEEEMEEEEVEEEEMEEEEETELFGALVSEGRERSTDGVSAIQAHYMNMNRA